MNAFDPYEYTITIRRVEPTIFEATIAELPDVAEYASRWATAYELAIDTLELTAEAIGNHMPQPMYKSH